MAYNYEGTPYIIIIIAYNYVLPRHSVIPYISWNLYISIGL